MCLGLGGSPKVLDRQKQVRKRKKVSKKHPDSSRYSFPDSSLPPPASRSLRATSATQSAHPLPSTTSLTPTTSLVSATLLPSIPFTYTREMTRFCTPSAVHSALPQPSAIGLLHSRPRGRSSPPSAIQIDAFIKHGETKATIEIELQKNPGTVTIKRKIESGGRGKTTWYIDNKECPEKNVKKLTKSKQTRASPSVFFFLPLFSSTLSTVSPFVF